MPDVPSSARITARQITIAIALIGVAGGYFGYLTVHSGTPGGRAVSTPSTGSDDVNLSFEPIAFLEDTGESEAGADPQEFNPRTVLGRAMKPIQNPPNIEADKVKNQVKGNDLVLGVVVNGEARAYPINLLCGPSREIINDELGNTAIAATW